MRVTVPGASALRAVGPHPPSKAIRHASTDCHHMAARRPLSQVAVNRFAAPHRTFPTIHRAGSAVVQHVVGPAGVRRISRVHLLAPACFNAAISQTGHTRPVRSVAPACHACSAGQPRRGSPRAPTSLARGDWPVRACRLSRHRRTPASATQPEPEITMDLETLIAQWSGQLSPGFVPHAVIGDESEPCSQPRCRRPRARKADGGWYKSCQPCLDRRAASCRRRRAALCRGRRLPSLLVSRKARGRLPLRAVPRRPGDRARAEAPGHHRRGGHRRVRRPTRPGPQGEQPLLRDLALEREAEAGTDCRLLVAAAGLGAARGARVGQVNQRHGVAV